MNLLTIVLTTITILLSASHVVYAWKSLPVKAPKQINSNTLQIERIVEVYDGDTIFVDIAGVPDVFGERIGIRLIGVDTPEIRTTHAKEKAWGYRAKAYVEHVLQTAERIEFVSPQRDKFFRIGCIVLVDGENLADMIISEGLGVPYTGGKRNRNLWKK